MENIYVFVSVLLVLAGKTSAYDDIECTYESDCNSCCDGYCCTHGDSDGESMSAGWVTLIVFASICGLAIKICCCYAIRRSYYQRRTVVVCRPAVATSTTVISTTTGPTPSTNPYHAGYNQHPMSHPAMAHPPTAQPPMAHPPTAQPPMAQPPTAQPPIYTRQELKGPPPAYSVTNNRV